MLDSFLDKIVFMGVVISIVLLFSCINKPKPVEESIATEDQENLGVFIDAAAITYFPASGGVTLQHAKDYVLITNTNDFTVIVQQYWLNNRSNADIIQWEKVLEANNSYTFKKRIHSYSYKILNTNRLQIGFIRTD